MMNEEEYEQKIHELKLALQNEKLSNQENTEEIERLIADKNDAQEASLKVHCEERRKLKETIQESEAKQRALFLKVEELQAIIEANKTIPTVIPEVHDCDPIINELAQEKELHGILKEKYNYLVEENEGRATEMKVMKSTLEQLLIQLNETQELLTLKKSCLAEVNEALKELQEENVILRSEIQIMKSSPQHELSRGNSVFKEVEDNRKKIVSAYNELKQKYRGMRAVITSKEHEINQLKVAMSSQSDKFQLDRGITNRYQHMTACMKRRIEELETLVHILEKRKESPEIVTITENDFARLDWVHTLVNDARKETRNVIAEYQKVTSHSFSLDMKMNEVQLESEQLKMDCYNQDRLNRELQLKNDSLENELKLYRSGSNGKDEQLTSTCPSNKIVRFMDDKLEETNCEHVDAKNIVEK